MKEPQEYIGDIESLKVPRNTEKDCYDFIAEDLDEAIRLLPDNEEDVYKRQQIIGPWVECRRTDRTTLQVGGKILLYTGCLFYTSGCFYAKVIWFMRFAKKRFIFLYDLSWDYEN